GLAEQRERGAVGGERHVRAAADIVVDAEDAHDGGRVDRRVARLVVEADVAAGDRDAEVVAGVRQALDRAGELPHDARVLRGAEVEAVGDGQGPRARGGDVAVRLGQRQLRARVRVQPGVAAVPVEGQGDAQAGLLVDADDARVVRHRQDRVAEDVPVVLRRHPRLAGEVRRTGQPQDGAAQLLAVGRAGEAARRV